jgi:predicted MPP superfamily phosphohydrolase
MTMTYEEGFERSGIEVRRFAGHDAYTGQLSHLRIAHLTDFHVGRVTPMRVQMEAVRRANLERPDLVVCTGDFVCHSTRYLDELTSVIAAFEAPVVCVLGNHDYWSGANEVRWALRRAGALVLSNQNTVLELRGQRLQLLGLDDAYTGHANREDALRGLRPDLPTLALSHIAEEADALWARGIPLVLSGHTHGGQVTFAKLHELAIGKIAGHKYVHGLYGTRAAPTRATGETGAVYVGAGIGAAVMPVRIGDRGRREVAIFELGYGPGSFVEHHLEQESLPGRRPSAAVKAKRRAKFEMKERRRASKLPRVA